MIDFTQGDIGTAELEILKLIKEKPKLNIGSNKDIRDTHINIDLLDIPGVDIKADCIDLYFIQTSSIKEILAYDVLEHFSFLDIKQVLNEWIRVLEPGGTIIVRVPDIEKILIQLVEQKLPVFEAQRLVFGGQDYCFNFHKAGFTSQMLEGYLLGCGCSEIIQIVKEDHNVTLVGRK